MDFLKGTQENRNDIITKTFMWLNANDKFLFTDLKFV